MRQGIEGGDARHWWAWRSRATRLIAVVLVALVVLFASVIVAGGAEPYDGYEAAVASDGPVTQYRVDDASGSSTIADSAGSYTATNSGIVLGGDGPFGGSKSGSFGGEAYATLPSSPVAGASAFSAEAWVDWTGGVSYEQPIFDFGSSSTNYMYLTPSDSSSEHTMRFEIRTGAGSDVQVTGPELTAEKWEYVAVTETSSGTLTLYLNGQQVGQTTGATIFPSSLASATEDYLGKSLIASAPLFSGSMSNAVFYDKALSAARIEAHYNAGEHPVNTVAPTISGTVKDGSALTAGEGTWTGLAPITYAYQWMLCDPSGEDCANIPAATETKYTPGHEDVGSTLRVAVTGTNGEGGSTTSSAQTAVVAAQAPSNTALPAISGEAEQGQLLSVSNGSWAGTPSFTYTYQWETCTSTGEHCENITGATASSYRVLGSQIGDTLRAVVSAENAAGSGSAGSEVTAAVAPQILIYVSQFGSEGYGEGQFRHPGDVSIDPNGDLWVLDTSNDRVQEFNEQGEYLRQFGSEGAGDGQFDEPYGTAVDTSGDLWVLDPGNDRVEEFNQNGEYLSQFALEIPGEGQLRFAEGIAVDAHGDVWVSDTYNGRIVVFNSDGEYLKTVGSEGSEPGQLGEPEGLAVDAHGDVWVADWENDRVEEFTEEGAFVGQFGGEGSGEGQLKMPYGIATDPSGDVFVGEFGNERVQEFTQSGEYVQQFGVPGAEEGEFGFGVPMGLAVDAQEEVWITDSDNDRVEKWAPGVPVAPSNVTPSSISGESVVGRTLNANPGGWSGTPPFAYTYQWQSCDEEGKECSDIEGATEARYRVEEADLGGTLRVDVTATNAAGTASSISAATSTISVGPPVNVAEPVISGTAQEGDTFTASEGEWEGASPITYTYQWQSCDSFGESCLDIAGATGDSYQLQASDVGTTVRVVVTAEDTGGFADAGSQPSAVVEDSAPISRAAPTISGVAQDGQALTASEGEWEGTPPFTYAYQWEACSVRGSECEIIEGATGAIYSLKSDDIGKALRVAVTASNAAGSATSTSETTSGVQPEGAIAGWPMMLTRPSISGEASEGHALSAVDGEWEGTEPFSYAYQWLRCNEQGEACSDISGATDATYTPTSSDMDDTLRVVVTSTNSVGSSIATSTPSDLVAGKPVNIAAPEITGATEEGETLDTSKGSWRAYPEPSYAYQWQDCYGPSEECSNIHDATGSTYTLRGSDAGTYPRVIVTATNASGSQHASGEVAEVIKASPPENVGAPEISGTARVGESLSATKGEWESELATFSYQWESCSGFGEGCTMIAGATGPTYSLRPTDADGTVRVAVTATVLGYASTTSHSVPTEVVAPGPYVSSEFGAAGVGLGEFNEPADVAIAKENILVLDRGNDRIERFSESGEYAGQFGSKGSGDGKLSEPASFAIDQYGDVWVMDTGNKRVEEFNESGEYLSQFSFGPPHYEGIAEGIAVTPDGDVWVADSGLGYIDIFTESGELLTKVGSGLLTKPEDLAVDSSGDVWVVDSWADEVDEFSEAGDLLEQFGKEGGSDGELRSPSGIAIGPDGEIWVGDVGNARLEEFNTDGEYVSQLGGYGTNLGEFELNNPMGLAVDSRGGWVSDAGNNRIERWLTPPAAPSNVDRPTILGEATDGQTLMAGIGEWSGVPSRFEYQWQRCNTSGEECEDIEGAHSQLYTLTSADLGVTISVVVSAVNAGGSTNASSTPSGEVVSATSPSNTTAPVIIGTARDGGTVKAEPGTWSGTPGVYAYQWESCNASGEECAPIEGAVESEYELGEGDIGTTVRVAVTSTNAAGSADAVSAASAEVAPEPPGELEAPWISGTPDEHQALQAHPGAWTGTERQFSYQWESCSSSGGECAPIEGATEPEYDLGEGDISTTMRVRIGVGSTLGAITDVSAVTPVIGAAGALASTTAPNISGPPQVGQSLTATPGGWSAAGAVSYAYQWQSCGGFGQDCANIEGATNPSYTPETGDAGSTLRVQVTASEEEHALSRVSPVTQPITTAGAPAVVQPPLIKGTSLQGGTLTATPGQWSGEGSITYTYQWERCSEVDDCVSIEGATSNSYTLTESDVGSMLRVLVKATNGDGGSEGLSTATARIDPESLLKFASPSIAGVVEIGGELEADPGIWSGSGSVSYSYQWERCNTHGEECAPIEAATEASYELVEGDNDHTLRVKITVKGPLGSESAYSATTIAAPGGEMTVEQAEEAAQETDPGVLAESTTATLDGETIAPTLSNEEQLFSEHALTSSSVSKENPGEFAINTPDGELSLKPLESSSKATTLPTLVNGTAALFANTSPATDTIIRPDALGATTVLHLRSAEAPKSFAWEIGLGPGEQLQQLTDGSIAVVSAPESGDESETETNTEPASPEVGEEAPETSAESAEKTHEEEESETEAPNESPPASPESSTASGEVPSGELEPENTLAQYEAATSATTAAEADFGTTALMVLQSPQVVDADGHTVPASLSVNGDDAILTIKPDETTTYPLLVAASVSAPSDKVSAERDPFEYGLADEKPGTFAGENPITHENARTFENVSRLKSKTAPLHIQTARKTIPWDILKGLPDEKLKNLDEIKGSHKEELKKEAEELKKLEEWLINVEADHLKPYITLKSDEINGPPSVPAYRTAMRNLISRFGRKVKRWGAWNEPDLGRNLVLPERAGRYWQAAQSVAVELHCACTIVAGEFAQYKTDSENKNPHVNRIYVSKYKKGLLTYFVPAWEHKHKPHPHAWAKNKIPHVWGFHDYADVIHDRSTNASEFERFASGKLGKPKIWISEAGVLLHTGGTPGAATRLVKKNDEPYEYEQQSNAANAFLALRYALPTHEKISRIQRVYYYGFEAPSEALIEKPHKANEFDSGLFETTPEERPAHAPKSYGEARPAYCYVAYENHDCPPAVSILPPTAIEGTTKSLERASVNPHGLLTSIEFYDDEFGLKEKVSSNTIQARQSIHPVIVGGGEFGSCSYPNYDAVASNAGGTVESKPFDEFPRCG